MSALINFRIVIKECISLSDDASDANIWQV